MSEEEQWPGLLDSLTEKLRPNNVPHQVAAQRTMEEKVGKVLDNPTIRKRILGWISSCSETKYSKSGTMAGRLRDQGNEKFVAKDNLGALKLYTESVICAPEVGPELSLALGNRSAALFHLGQYQEASDDIKLALVHKYPRNTEHKLHQRQAQCLVRMARYREALEHLATSSTALGYSKLSQEKQDAVGRDLTALTTEATSLLEREAGKEEVVKPLEERWEEGGLPGASHKLRLENSGDKVRGRYVVADTAVAAGELVVREVPYSLVLLPEHSTSRCSLCLSGPLVSPLSCRRCTQPRYCSAACQSSAWEKHHQWECGHLDLLHSVGVGHLALRTLLTAGLPTLLSLQKAAQGGASPEVDPREPYTRVLALQHHLDRLPVEDQFQYTVTAALLLELLHRNTAFLCPSRAVQGVPGLLKPLTPALELGDKQQHYLGALLLRHLAQLVTNAHAVTELQEGEAGEVRQVRLATGIYPAASMLNHSCIPAIINSFKGGVLEIRAVRAVSGGEEVTNCYGPHYRRHGHQERQHLLQEQYGFRCHCPACASQEERTFFSQFQANLCSKNINGCDGPVEVHFKGPKSTGGVCGKCGLAQDLESGGWQAAQEEARLQPCLTSLARAETVMAGRLYKHHHQLAQVRDDLAHHMVESGDYQGAEVMLRKTLDTAGVRYGEDSIEYGNELLKYTDILAALLNEDKAVNTKEMVKFLQTARVIFLIQYGEKSNQAQEIKEKLEFFETIGVTKEA